MISFSIKFITILATILLLNNIQVCQSLFCYSCFNTPNNVYPIFPCPRVIEFSLMNIIQCEDKDNSCVMYTEKDGDLEYPTAAGCSWRRIEPEKSTSYVRTCQNGRCEQFCGTDYCRYKWP